jgi:elongation factor 2
VELLYAGPLDDQTASSIRNCDPDGPLIVYISKMVPNKENTRFYAFGRVFSGTMRSKKVNILEADFEPGNAEKKDKAHFEKQATGIYIMMGGYKETIDSVPCGNTVMIAGIDAYIGKTCTLSDQFDSYPLVITFFNSYYFSCKRESSFFFPYIIM